MKFEGNLAHQEDIYQKDEYFEVENEYDSEKFNKVEELRDKAYLEDIKNCPEDEQIRREAELKVLNNHNKTVLDYAENLISQLDLDIDEEVASSLAVILHDSGKLNSEILDHHEASEKRAEEILSEFKNKEFQGVKITPELQKIIKDAINRHMNHPFLVMLNKGKKFPTPETIVDKITYDSDMLANIGFKNIGFRLSNEKFLAEDQIKAKEKNITPLEESFNNILKGELGVEGLKKVILLPESKSIADNIMKELDKIILYFKENNIFSEIQSKFIKDNPGLNIKLVNEAIQKAGIELEMDSSLIQKFLI